MATSKEDRLQELLDIKDEQMGELEGRVSELEGQLRFGTDWMFQRRADDNEHPRLPVPRIQMTVFVPENAHYQESEVAMVIRHRDSNITTVPVSYSKSSGRVLDAKRFPLKGALPDDFIGLLPNGILSDACHLSEQTGIPAFVVLDEDRQYRITNMRPHLKMEAVK